MKLKDLVEKYLEPVERIFLPKVGERYYYIDDCMI